MMEKSIQVNYNHFDNWSELDNEDQDLVKAANKVRDTAYAPYSKFHVGAAASLSDGTVVTGSNQENIAYPSGLCAERVALFYAGANFPNENVKTLCIVAKGELVPQDKLLSPCGGCRQVMVETESRQKGSFRVILVNQDNSVMIFNSAKDLLPLAFGVK